MRTPSYGRNLRPHPCREMPPFNNDPPKEKNNMLNVYTPFPRYENAIIVGDTAAEALAALRIYGRGLVGGDIPAMEVWHPTEKMLECTSCAIHDRPSILESAARRIGAEYILLEENGDPHLNPIVMKEPLEAAGFTVKVLDVKGEALEVVARAAALYGEEKQAERIARDYEERLAAVKAKPALPKLRVLTLLGIRHPIEDAVYCLAATRRSDLSAEIVEALGCENPVDVPESSEQIRGMYSLSEQSLADLILASAPDAVVLSGDSTAAWKFVKQALELRPTIGVGKAFRHHALIALPWYCRPMGWRMPRVLEVWYGALSALAR